MRKWIVLCMMLLVCSAAHGTAYEWVGTDTYGAWNTDTNWDPVGVPGAADTVHIGNGPYGVDFNGATITLGEIEVDNGAGIGNSGWGEDFVIIVTDNGGTSGDFLYRDDADSRMNTSGANFSFDVAGHALIGARYDLRWNYSASKTNYLILRGDNKAHYERAGNGRNFNAVDIYGSYYDNGSNFSYSCLSTVTVKSGGQIIGRPGDEESTWYARRFIFEDGQANMPGADSLVSFTYQCTTDDNGPGKLVVTGGVDYPLDLSITQNYFGDSFVGFSPYEWKLTGGDITVGRDLYVGNSGGRARATFVFDTADNDTGVSNNIVVGRDLRLNPTWDAQTVYALKLNDSEVTVKRDMVLGAYSGWYYLWTPHNNSLVDLGGATIRVGGDFTVQRMTPEALVAWNGGTSTIIFDGGDNGLAIPPGYPYYGRQNVTVWGAESPLHNVIVDTLGTVYMVSYQYGDATGGDNATPSLYLTGDFKILNGTFDQNNVPIIFNGPEHNLEVDNVVRNPLDQIELLADAVVLMGSDVTMGDLTMGTDSKIYLQDFELKIVSDNATYSGVGQWAYDGGLIIGGPLHVPGDANGDGKVDGTDLAIWQQNYDPLGTGNATFATGDWNGDGKVDGTDLALWQQNYDPLGTGGLDGLGTGVPEPATLLLLGTGLIGAVGAARRRRMK